jgi:hypothetical protein
MVNRPSQCRDCRWGYKTSGFVPPFVGSDPKIAFVLPQPDSQEIISREALDSDRGRHFLRTYCEPYGLEKENLVVKYVLACLSPFDNRTRQRIYPTSAVLKNQAERACDKYSPLHGKEGHLVPGGIVKFDPDIFVFALDPQDTLRIPAYTRLIQRSVEKGMMFQSLGYRPCVLFGKESVALQFPFVEKVLGGLKAMNGNYVEGKWRSVPKNNNPFIIKD